MLLDRYWRNQPTHELQRVDQLRVDEIGVGAHVDEKLLAEEPGQVVNDGWVACMARRIQKRP